MNNPLIIGTMSGMVTFFVCLWIITIIDQKQGVRNQNLLLKGAIVLAGIFIIIAFSAPSFFTSDKYFSPEAFKQYGPIGDAIGGLMNPFIGISAVIVTGLAFYAQFQANNELKIQFEKQQKQYQLDKFESQFYEMLRLHKENVNEMSIEGYEYKFELNENKIKEIYQEVTECKSREDNLPLNSSQILEKKNIDGRKIFYLMTKELHALYCVVKKVYKAEFHGQLNYLDSEFKFPNNVIAKMYFTIAYSVFFEGKDVIDNKSWEKKLKFHLDGVDRTIFLKKLKTELEILRTCHKQGVRYISQYLENGSKDSQMLNLQFSYKPFGGHHIRLPHYYRHMFNLVKHVVNQSNDLLSYEDKRRYLKIFRAQLSNHEIVLLYYNWLTEFGKAWEEPLSKMGNRNRFFTNYRILHNLNADLVLSEFEPYILFENTENTDFIYQGDISEKDRLFELYGLESSLSIEANREMKKAI